MTGSCPTVSAILDYFASDAELPKFAVRVRGGSISRHVGLSNGMV
jgi:hypothetical protein